MTFDYLQPGLDALQARGRFRELEPTKTLDGPWIERQGRRLVNLSSNDYLGLRQHPEVIEAATQAATSGAGSAALIGGYTEAQAALEADLATSLGTESALVFGSGFLANFGLISRLIGVGDTLLSDSLNHASLIEGCRASKAQISVFDHQNLADLEAKLRVASGRKVIVSETIFSMDGDAAKVTEIRQLANQHDALIIWDEAHAIGVRGPEGWGLLSEFGGPKDNEAVVLTFGKTLASYGAAVAGPQVLRSYLINHARSFIFTTALPPAAIAAAHTAMQLMQRESGHLVLASLRHGFRAAWQQAGLPCHGDSAIFPVVVGEDRAAVDLMRQAATEGQYIQAIRPPTVPEGTARIRITLTTLLADHSLERTTEVILSSWKERAAHG